MSRAGIIKGRTMKSSGHIRFCAALAVVGLGLGCGGASQPGPKAVKGGGGVVESTNRKVEQAARDKFAAALELFNAHDKANDWNDQTCAQVAKRFESASDAQGGGTLPEATYDAGLAYQRCNNDKEAKERFQRALSDDAKFHHARVQLALYQFKVDGDVNAAISALEQAVADASFQNVPALVNLAMFQMQRDSDMVGANCQARSGGKDVTLQDFDCAKLNLQRALAIDDGYMPAFNQLALYYFGAAKKKGATGGKRFGRTIATNAALGKRGDVQQLELAALVCSQAVHKSQSYAPIHNTSGLILNELGQVNSAVKEFQTAAQLDPHFFEAQMNLAAINLSFRGFDKAEGAYRHALEMHLNDYDAHLGLALALRGQIDESNYDKQVAAVQAEIDACKKIDPARPDAYFNEGILTQEYKAKGAGALEKSLAVYDQATAIFQDFIEKASGKPEYDGAIKKAKERLQDIVDTENFLKAGPAPSETPDAGPADSGAPADAAVASDGGAALVSDAGAELMSDGGAPAVTTHVGEGGIGEAGPMATPQAAAAVPASGAATVDASARPRK
jgi:tetratricopeptide (TPR) repeat protein